jgi:hypothetical protein
MGDLSELSIDGRVATPGDSDWDLARQAWNLIADQHPAAVAFVETADDVSKVIRFASERDLKVTAQSTGHGAAALGGLDDTILIKTDRMRDIYVDPDARRARVGAGTLAMDLAAAASERGLSFLPGSAPTVGVAGFTLGGGVTWLGRRYGFACNRVTAIDLVTADGEARTVDADNDGDLFWALRGGGGGYAIVTELHLALVPVADVYAGLVVFPAELGARAVRAYRDWAATVPDEVTANIRFLRPPPVPDVPEQLRDRPLFVIGVTCIGTQAEGEQIVAPMRELGEPIMDTFGQIPAGQLGRIAMDPEQPVPGLGHSRLLRDLPDGAIDAFVGAADPAAGSPLTVAELRQLGGALGRPAENPGALAAVDAAFLMVGIGAAMTPEMGEAIGRHLDHLAATMEPWTADGGLFNFVERSADVDEILPADTVARLADVKRRWDPDGRIRANHEVSLAAV